MKAVGAVSGKLDAAVRFISRSTSMAHRSGETAGTP